MLRLLKRRAARTSLLEFTRFTKPDYEVNWHHRVMCAKLDELVAGKIKRLIVCMPPRHGKSECVSRRLPAYVLGRNPDAQIIACSYGSDLASAMNRDVQRIIDTPEYAELFPETKLNISNVRTMTGSSLRNSDIFEIPGHRGMYKSAGVGSGVTGRGADFALIDDPVRNRADADSPTYREKLWEWYTSTFYTRLEKGASVLVVSTRWHEDDLVGRLLRLAAQDPTADQWEVISFPAIAEGTSTEGDPRKPGEALWPNKYDVHALSKIKAALGSFEWASLYQQRPAPAAGGVFKTRWWRFWFHRDNPLPPVKLKLDTGELIECKVAARPVAFTEEAQSWDMTFKGLESAKGVPDYVVGQAWGRQGADSFLLDEVRGQWEFIEALEQVQLFTAKHPETRSKFVEAKANGPAIISTLSRQIPGLIPVEPDGDKVARARAITHAVEAGNVWLPHPSIAPWVWDSIHECSTFPSGKNDDRVDAMTQILRRWTVNFVSDYEPADDFESSPLSPSASMGLY